MNGEHLEKLTFVTFFEMPLNVKEVPYDVAEF